MTIKNNDTPGQPESTGVDLAKIANQKFIETLSIHLRAACPAMVVDVNDRCQLVLDVKAVAETQLEEVMNVVSWNADTGLAHHPHGSIQDRPVGNATETAHPMKAMETVKNIIFGVDTKNAAFSEKTIFVFRNFQDCWDMRQPFGPSRSFSVTEMIINCLNIFKHKNCAFLFFGPSMQIPPTLLNEVQRLEYSLPGADALMEKFKHIETSVQQRKPELYVPATDEAATKAVNSTQGLTITKAEQSFAISLIKNDYQFNTDSFWRSCADLRRNYIKEMGLVEIVKPHGGFKETFGGYEYIQDVIRKDMTAMTPEAQEFGVDKPAGFLVGGPAGTGKSVLVKATGHDFGLDVLWVSANKILDSKYGESEKRLKAILDIPELYSGCGCILWFDECDKLFGSLTSKGDDSTSGTGLRLLSILLTYLQERNYNPNDRAYIMATFNDGDMLPDALVRPGRFNSRVWIGLPKESEREEILKLHLTRRKQNADDYDVAAFAKLAEGFTGAELEYVVSESIKQLFCDDPTVSKEDSKSKLNQLIVDRIGMVLPQSQNEKSDYHEQTAWAEQSGFVSGCDVTRDTLSVQNSSSAEYTLGLGLPDKMVKVTDTNLNKKKKKNDNSK
jgi:hypothetical protein